MKCCPQEESRASLRSTESERYEAARNPSSREGDLKTWGTLDSFILLRYFSLSESSENAFSYPRCEDPQVNTSKELSVVSGAQQ